jgi:hypothetical protein
LSWDQWTMKPGTAQKELEIMSIKPPKDIFNPDFQENR